MNIQIEAKAPKTLAIQARSGQEITRQQIVDSWRKVSPRALYPAGFARCRREVLGKTQLIDDTR